MKVFVDTAQWFLRPNNSDWRYALQIEEISKYMGDIEFYYPKGFSNLLEVNLSYLSRALTGRLVRLLGLSPKLRREHLIDYVCERELKSSQADLVFSHRGFPVNSSAPVIWQNSILDPHMAHARGIPPADVLRESRLKREFFHRARRVQVSSNAEAIRLSALYPELADRFVPVPFFLPHIKPIPAENVTIKFRAPQILHFVFVGREANRKGLSLVLSALKKIGFGNRADVCLTIVTDFSDGRITLPNWPNLFWHKQLTLESVQRLFSESHVFLMPSHFESYGWVYIEAMAQGCIPVATNWEVQSEILDYGRAGYLTRADVGSMIATLNEIIEGDTPTLLAKAQQALQRVVQHYSPIAVACQYRKLFIGALRLVDEEIA